MAALVEKELSMHNKPNLSMSIITFHNSNIVPTVIDVLFQTPQNTSQSLYLNISELQYGLD